jgi:hypothetical protein
MLMLVLVVVRVAAPGPKNYAILGHLSNGGHGRERL